MEVVHVVSSCILLNEMGDQKTNISFTTKPSLLFKYAAAMSSVSGQCRLKKGNGHYSKMRTESK